MFFNTQKPHPGRRRTSLTPIVTILALLLSISSMTAAYEMTFENGIYNSIQYREFEERGEIHFDNRPEPMVELERRQVGQDSSSSSTSAAPSSTVTDSAASAPSTNAQSSSSIASQGTATTSLALAPSTTVISTPLPSPFDTSLGNNFTSTSCPTFFTNFLSNSTFRACTPISLLLQNSASYFRAQRSPSLLDATLSAACSAPISVCAPLMTYLASELMSDNACGRDFRDQQPLVLQAYNGLIAYEPVYKATCIKDPNNEYCYANAITNSSNPGDSYPYYTAIGLNLPNSAKPTCNECLHKTMQVFADYAVMKEQPLSQTYLACATQMDASCGAGFADTSVKVGSVDSGMGDKAQNLKNAAQRSVGGGVGVMMLAGVVGLLFML